LGPEERETVLLISAADKYWDCFTNDPRSVAKLKKRGYNPRQDHQGYFSCRIPKKKITIRRPDEVTASSNATDVLLNALEGSRSLN